MVIFRQSRPRRFRLLPHMAASWLDGWPKVRRDVSSWPSTDGPKPGLAVNDDRLLRNNPAAYPFPRFVSLLMWSNE